MSQYRNFILVLQVPNPPCRAEAKLDHTALHKNNIGTATNVNDLKIIGTLRRTPQCDKRPQQA
jgi:hypothetical protein